MAAAVFVFAACRQDKLEPVPEECQSGTVSYSQKVEPLILNNCSISGCHDATNSGGYTFSNHSDISSNASTILGVIRHEAGTPMPLGGPKLADSLIAQVNCWIIQGKQDN